MSACLNSTMEEMKGLFQRKYKAVSEDCFLFGGWFESKNSSKYTKHIFSDFIVIMKTIGWGGGGVKPPSRI